VIKAATANAHHRLRIMSTLLFDCPGAWGACWNTRREEQAHFARQFRYKLNRPDNIRALAGRVKKPLTAKMGKQAGECLLAKESDTPMATCSGSWSGCLAVGSPAVFSISKTTYQCFAYFLTNSGQGLVIDYIYWQSRESPLVQRFASFLAKNANLSRQTLCWTC
jgi:hypothetical protein